MRSADEAQGHWLGQSQGKKVGLSKNYADLIGIVKFAIFPLWFLAKILMVLVKSEKKKFLRPGYKDHFFCPGLGWWSL